MKTENLIQTKSFDFSLMIIELYKVLISRNEYVISKQLIKSGTSIGANIGEALAGQSGKDFLSKMSIASKEVRETKYWLRLLNRSKLIVYDFTLYMNEIESIIKILTSIVKTTNENLIQNPKLKI
jgi:four helix bundle protein